MAMLGFEQGFALGSSNTLIAKVKEKIGELNSAGTVIPDATQKVIYKKLCTQYKTAPIDVFKKMSADKKSLVMRACLGALAPTCPPTPRMLQSTSHL